MSPTPRRRPDRTPLYLAHSNGQDYDDTDADLRAAAMLETVARATEAANVSRAHRLLEAAPPSGTAAEPLDNGEAPFVLREYAAELTDALRDVLATIDARASRLRHPAPYGPDIAERLRMATILIGHMWSTLGNAHITAHQMRTMNRQLRESLRASVTVADELGRRLGGPSSTSSTSGRERGGDHPDAPGPDQGGGSGPRCRKGGTP
ncbi:hypothetical protein RKE29_27465 [Streptomyces sp. B1866]|uniref:hypothetical protein n=1 Tax=Streptomyces sp. B1866 TaxID=3075431 RepID=UPI00288FA9FA|nr:hypothetical protein [Streptomyces sp. B1866]MDT3400306.1 hypothetical protein [Streptomyces sp. B1866]